MTLQMSIWANLHFPRLDFRCLGFGEKKYTIISVKYHVRESAGHFLVT